MNKSAVVDTAVDTAGGSKYTKVIYMVLIAIASIVVIAIIVSIYKSSKAGGDALGSELGKQFVQAQTGIAPARQSVCKSVAEDVRNAMTCVWGTNYILWASSDSIADALNRLNTSGEAALTSSYFKEANGVSLKSQLSELTAGYDALMARIKDEVKSGLS